MLLKLHQYYCSILYKRQKVEILDAQLKRCKNEVRNDIDMNNKYN